MSDFVTPRKRKVGGGDAAGSTSGRKRAPAPNPPVMPFPTPPRTGSRRSRPSDTDPFFAASASDISDSIMQTPQRSNNFPPHLQTLLTLHRAFNVALSLHIATHPPVLPPHSPSATSVKLPNLTNLLAMKETIERTGGRRFGVPELQRLAWIWSWDGVDPDNQHDSAEASAEDDGQTGPSRSTKEEDNPFLVPTSPAQCPTLEISGLDYLISPTRTLDPASGRRVYTYGIGIELQLRAGETRQLLHGGLEGGLLNKGQGGGMGAVGRWNVAGEEREEVVKDRLRRWCDLHGGCEETPSIVMNNGLPTPPSTRDREAPRSSIPPIPLLPLPHLPSSTLLPSANLFGASPSPSSAKIGLGMGLTSVTSLNVTPVRTPATSSGLSDPFVLKDANEDKLTTPTKGTAGETGEGEGTVKKSGGKAGLEARKQAMMDRIKARKTQKGGLQTLGYSISDSNSPRMGQGLSKADTQEELKRRSTLSRLEGVAEAVWMMFSAPAQSTTSVTLTPPRGRRKAVPMVEAAEVIVKSSKTPISIAEAQASLTLLTQLCPFFLQLKVIGRSEWLEMPPQVAAAVPSSPGTSTLGHAASVLPRHAHLPAPPSSPSRARPLSNSGLTPEGAAMPAGPLQPPKTPTTPGRSSLLSMQMHIRGEDDTADSDGDNRVLGGGIILTPGKGAGTYAHVSDTHNLVSPLRTRTTPRAGMPSPSPGRAARMAAMELNGASLASANAMSALREDEPMNAGAGAMAGPASPGRVRRVGGLREVRERIRRELGE